MDAGIINDGACTSGANHGEQAELGELCLLVSIGVARFSLQEQFLHVLLIFLGTITTPADGKMSSNCGSNHHDDASQEIARAGQYPNRHRKARQEDRDCNNYFQLHFATPMNTCADITSKLL
ncbi:hypothetical protein [Arthrobacter sp. SD76]|uniref:hypothetical protein n=1 Tax=Arthrobacter sp. SD76 TaxID=3415007 RepID=UPI003C732CD2